MMPSRKNWSKNLCLCFNFCKSQCSNLNQDFWQWYCNNRNLSFQKFTSLQELSIEFEAGKSLRYITVHHLAASPGLKKLKALPLFHAFCSCDTNLMISRKSKNLFLETWEVKDELTLAFYRISSIIPPDDITDKDFKLLEKLVILLYSKSCNTFEDNEARRILFKIQKSIENISAHPSSFERAYFSVTKVVSDTT